MTVKPGTSKPGVAASPPGKMADARSAESRAKAEPVVRRKHKGIRKRRGELEAIAKDKSPDDARGKAREEPEGKPGGGRGECRQKSAGGAGKVPAKVTIEETQS